MTAPFRAATELVHALGMKTAPGLELDVTQGEPTMSDDKTKTGGQDRKRISLSEDYEVRDWSKRFGCTADELKAAVKAVGNEASAVEEYLKRRKN
jgi:hypothetical protein